MLTKQRIFSASSSTIERRVMSPRLVQSLVLRNKTTISKDTPIDFTSNRVPTATETRIPTTNRAGSKSSAINSQQHRTSTSSQGSSSTKSLLTTTSIPTQSTLMSTIPSRIPNPGTNSLAPALQPPWTQSYKQFSDEAINDLLTVVSKQSEAQLSPATCANGFYALGKYLNKNKSALTPAASSGNLARDLRSALEKLVSSSVDKNFNKNQVLKIYYGVATGRLDLLDLRLPRLLKRLIDVSAKSSKESLHELSSQQITNLIMSLAKLGKPGSTMLQESSSKENLYLVRLLASEICTRGIKDFNSRDISTLMWSLATLGEPSNKEEQQVCQLVSEEISRRGLRDFTPQGMSNLVWSLATLEYESSSFLQALSEEICSQGFSHFNEQDISNLVWSLAKFSRKDDAVLALVLQEISPAKRGIRSFNSQGITNLISSLVKLGLDESPSTNRFAQVAKDSHVIFAQVAEEISRRGGLRMFSNQAITNLAWSFGTGGSKNSRFFDQVAKEILARDLRELSSQHISNLVLGFAKSGHKNDSLLDAVSMHILRRCGLKDYTSQGISNVIWSFTKLEKYDEPLLDAISNEICRRGLDDFTSQAIANTIWSLTKLGRYYNKQLVDLISLEVSKRRLKDFDPMDVSCLVWSYATLGVPNNELLDLVPDSFMIEQSSFQSICNIAWSFACLDVIDTPAANRFFNLTIPESIQVEYISEVAVQVHQCRVAWEQRYGKGKLPRLLEGLVKDGEWVNSTVCERNSRNESSSSHLEVSTCLIEMGFTDLQNEFVTGNAISVDIILPSLFRGNVVIEVDGPFHFLNDGKTPTGATMFKRRLLEREGYKVLTINVMHEWRKFSTRAEQKAFLRDLLSQAVLSSTVTTDLKV